MQLPAKTGALLAVAITAVFSLLLFWPAAWQTASEEASSALYTRFRGERPLDERIVFVHIAAEDVQDLGGWPITRDYYGYFLHALSEQRPRVIAFDILMENPRHDYPEFDKMFADYLETSTNVVLPMAYSLFSAPSGNDGLFHGEAPSWPHAAFLKNLRGCGFSNLPVTGELSRLPLVIMDRDSLRLSLAAEIMRQYWGGSAFQVQSDRLTLHDQKGKVHQIVLDGKGQLRLNHFGGRNLQQIGFVEALQRLHERPGDLTLRDRIVFIGVVAPGIAVSKATALNPALPASLLQLTAVENILRGNYLVPLPVWLQFTLLVLLSSALYVLFRPLSMLRAILSTFASLVLIVTMGQILFMWHWIWPLFSPLAVVLGAALASLLSKARVQRQETEEVQAFLREEIEKKSQALQAAQSQLEAMQEQIMTAGARMNEQEMQRLTEKQNAIAELEMRLADLRAAVQPGQLCEEKKYDILYSVNSPMTAVIQTIEMLSSSDIAVILQGETGTGKELIARAIHRAGRRSHSLFLAVNCSALPETLLESELFGHEKGSFTGAVARRRGLFELADTGTLFLDEISETSPAFQAKLLRVLQEKEVQRLGGETQIPVDVRVIAATNRDLEQLVQQQKFRMDLFYRLNGMTITLPALRERMMDIPILARHFLALLDADKPVTLSETALLILIDYDWPGNIRELENVLRRATLLARGSGREIIHKEDLPDNLLTKKRDESVYLSLEEQILHSLRTLEFSHAAIAQTAQTLGGRDRGTITEYFRGICFEYLVAENYSIGDAARALAGTGKSKSIGRVMKKMQAYLNNLRTHAKGPEFTAFKGLPQKYHSALHKVIEHLDEIE